MGRPRQFDDDTVLEAAMTTFWSKGFEATSVADLVQATGLNRASLYGSFGPKQDVMAEALAHYDRTRVEPMLEMLRVGGIDGILGFFSQFATLAAESPDMAALGCLLVNTTTEAATINPAFAAATGRYRRRLAKAMCAAVEGAVSAGDLSGPIENKADQLMLSTIGLFVTLRGGAATVEAGRLVDSVLDLVESWRSATPRPSADSDQP